MEYSNKLPVITYTTGMGVINVPERITDWLRMIIDVYNLVWKASDVFNSNKYITSSTFS